MSTWLQAFPFDPEQHLRLTANFDCGPEEWSVEAADWIAGRGSDSVIDYHSRHCYIRLYGTTEQGLVGFGSIKETLWNWPSPSDRRAKLSMIPMLGIQQQFRGLPRGEGERRFSEQIIDDLVAEALDHPDRVPLLGLYVHPENKRAIAFYRRVGFEPFHKTWTNPDTGVVYPSMLRDIRNTPLEE